MVLLHYTGMKTAEGAAAWLCDPASKVSAHYLVDEDGSIVQMVPEAARAWHAGVSSWEGRGGLNACSIGIEIVNPGHEHGYRDFPDAQIAAVMRLLTDVLERRLISPARVVAHSDVAPDRKEDPGERFPWRRLHEAGLAIWAPKGDPCGLEDLKDDLRSFGYPVSDEHDFTKRDRLCLIAFQRRFMPDRVDGSPDRDCAGAVKAALSAKRSIARDALSD